MSALTLNQIVYDERIFNSHIECSFCMENFEQDQPVIVLPCDSRHYFHSRCILVWSRTQKNCPLCKIGFDEAKIKAFRPKLTKLLANSAAVKNNAAAQGWSKIFK